MRNLGVRLPVENDWDEAIEYARTADSLGFSSLWVAEGWDRNVVPLITRLFEATDEIDVCTGIVNIYSRTPALMAMTARAFCDSYGERFRLGIGVSSKAIIEGLHGHSFESPLRRTREYIEIINTLLAGEATDYEGHFFDLSGFTLQDIDQSYDVPVYVAAMGNKNLQLVGEFADGWLPLFVPLDQFETTSETIREGANRQGRSLEAIQQTPYVPTCISSEDPKAATRHVRDLIAWYIGGMGEYYHRTISDFGYRETADAIKTAWQNGNHEDARDAVSESLLDACSICGGPDEAAATIENYYDAGVDELTLYIPPRAPQKLIQETLSHASESVSSSSN